MPTEHPRIDDRTVNYAAPNSSSPNNMHFSVIARPTTWFIASFVALGACLCMAGPHRSLPQAGRVDGLGFNIHFTDPRSGEVDMLAAAGARWVRMDLTWSRTEREPGRYDFSPYDRLLEALRPHDIRVLLILDYSNRLYEKDRSVVSETGRQAFARWAAAAAKHFQGRGILWEIWNEPNIAGFWQPQPKVEDYAALALSAAQSIRRAAPGEAIIGPATSRIDLEFLKGCFQHGLLEWWDAVSVHPYRQSPPETAAAEYDKLRRLIDRYAPPGKIVPILSDEWGYSSAWQGFDSTGQGKMLSRQWLTNLWQAVPLSIWYDWHDDGTDPREPEHHFGTVEHAYRPIVAPVYKPKPAYRAAQTLTSTFAGFQFSKRLATGSADEYALLFRRGDDLRVAVWTTAETSRTVDLPSSPCRFQRVSYLGEPRPLLEAGERVVRVDATDSPQYLIALSSNRRLADAPAARRLTAQLLPVLNHTLTARISKRDAAPFRGRVELVDVQGIEPLESTRPLSLAVEADHTTVQFPLAPRPVRDYRAGLRVVDVDGHRMLELTPRRLISLSDEFWARSRLVPDGAPDVSCACHSVLAPAPEPLAGSGSPVLKIVYRFDAGWKYIRLTPIQGQRRMIHGEPIAFGMWVWGDANGGSPRLRVRDSTGQLWQPTGPSIDWRGWRFVEFSLGGSTEHWHGANDGILHFPLRWDSIFLLDNVSRKPLQGTIYITSPVVIYNQ